MTRNAIIGLSVGGAAALLLLVTLARPWPAPAQQPAAATAQTSLPAGYVGAETCKGCHEEAYKKFETTKMGRLFLKQARNTKESVGCENCHGPGQKHVEAGGGKGVGGMITFAKNDKTPVETRNAMCTSCHAKGPLFWKGSAHEARDVACTGCHKVMEEVSPRHQLARPTEIETCGACHLQKRAQQMRSSHMPLREGKMTCTSCHNANYSNALGRIETRNPTAPVSGTAAQDATAKAQRFPAFEDTLARLEAALIYHFYKNWSAKLGYAFEMFEKTDWRTDTLNPFIPGVSSIWLGNDLRNYTAHMMGVALSYRFK